MTVFGQGVERQGNHQRLFLIVEETRREFKKDLPLDVSDRDLTLVAFGVRLARIHALSNEVRGLGNLVHLPQIRQDIVDLPILRGRLNKQDGR